MKQLFKRLFQCFDKKHVSLTESCSVIRKTGDEQGSFTCSDCQKTYKQCVGFYEADSSNIFICIKCHDGPEKFREVVSKSHCCPFYSKDPCDLTFEYSCGMKYKCNLCGRGPFNTLTGRFCCKLHAFNVCWECIHPPFSFIVCPYHPYLRLDNTTGEDDKNGQETYACQVCLKKGKASEGRYQCPIKGCKYEICWKCFTAPVYFEEKSDRNEESKREPTEAEEENKSVNLDNSISHADFGIEFNIEKGKIEMSPSVGIEEGGSAISSEFNNPNKFIHIDV